MSADKSPQIVLAARPRGNPTLDDFWGLRGLGGITVTLYSTP
jgi:hypothetical protein